MQQCLIFAGRILKDSETLENQGWSDSAPGSALYWVQGKAVLDTLTNGLL